MIENNNKFKFEYLELILKYALDKSYSFVTLNEFVKLGCPSEGFFVLRLDLDFKPQTFKPFLNLIKTLNIVATLFVRVVGPYNVLWYNNYKLIQSAANFNCEIGLHTSAVEWSIINENDPYKSLNSELALLRSFFEINGIAPHRDINYMYNSLPWLEKNWTKISKSYKLNYHSYESKIIDNVIYVNEGLSPHLGWRNHDPFDAIRTGKSVCMLLHPHWWYSDYAFEAD
jgi:hypothetical protein